MSDESRRRFLLKFGLTVGTLAIGREIVHALPPALLQDKTGPVRTTSSPETPVDFRYAPDSWQSQTCFPYDASKSLVSDTGELLFGMETGVADPQDVLNRVKVVLAGRGPGTLVGQHLDSPQIPIITTTYDYADVTCKLVAFATNDEEEGRVDNLLIEVTSKTTAELEIVAEIQIDSKSIFTPSTDDDYGLLHVNDVGKTMFLLASTPLVAGGNGPKQTFRMRDLKMSATRPARFVVRIPRASQTPGVLQDRLRKPEELLKQVREYWTTWSPTGGNVKWDLPGEYGNFFTASERVIAQASSNQQGKKTFRFGPVEQGGMSFVDGACYLEALRYAGHDTEALEGLKSMWASQLANGSFAGAGGEQNFKETAAAVYSLVRQAELDQNWDYFNELYPDAVKAMAYLRDHRDKALNGETSNGKYQILPQGMLDDSIPGTHAELTNTLWAMLALKGLFEIADNLFLQRRAEMREFYADLRRTFFAASREEMHRHAGGFSFLPMLLKDDPYWSPQDRVAQPRLQIGQGHLGQAIAPGFLFEKDDSILKGYIELMKAVAQEEIPAATGSMSGDAVALRDAAIAAQVFLWQGDPILARKTFIGLLNHASPLYSWWTEQSIHNASHALFTGRMPDSRVSVECIRYLRHMLILEDRDTLRLLDGIGIEDLVPKKAMSLTYSPTKWGRISVRLEPLEERAWSVKYKREQFKAERNPKLTYVEMPRHLPGNFQYDKAVGVTKVYKNGPRLLIDPEATEWQATYRNFSRMK